VPILSAASRIESIEVVTLAVTPKGNWTFVRLHARDGSTGLGEATHAMGFTRASAEDDARIAEALRALFRHAQGRAPDDVAGFRAAAAEDLRDGGLLVRTAFSALEQAMWDLRGKQLGVPVHTLLGERLKDAVPCYANINRAVVDRSPESFAKHARLAVAEGFRGLKAAVFDDYPATPAEVGIARLQAMREAVGPGVDLMVDCHNRFDPPTAVDVARQLEPLQLSWYEEPVDPADAAATAAIRRAIPQRLAAGEMHFEVKGFQPLLDAQAVDVIMPDVKHCGGLAEGLRIAHEAERRGVEVSPHNPSGPVSMLASAHLAAVLPNCVRLEHAWGEVDWRADLLDPPEQFRDGALLLSDRPGLGHELNPETVARYRT